MIATARDLRFRTSDLLSAVRRGEEVVITFRGKPTALLSALRQKPLKKGASGFSEIFGLWKGHTKTANVAAYVRSLRRNRFE